MKQKFKDILMDNKVITFIALLLIPFIPVRVIVYDAPLALVPINLIQFSKMVLTSFGLQSRWERAYMVLESSISILFIFLIYLIVSRVRKIFKKKKISQKIRYMLKGSKPGYVIFSLSMLTLPYLIFTFIVGKYGGTSQTPGILVSFYYVFKYIAVLLLPFTWISFFMMKFGSILLVLVSYLIDFGTFEYISDPSYLMWLKVYSFIILILLMVALWNIFSTFAGNIILKFYNRHRGMNLK